MSNNHIDINENYINRLDRSLLKILLKDRSSGKNIIWATDNYADKGIGYQRHDHIALSAITGYNGNIIKPRVSKSKKEQAERIRQKAEVFTPSWICNKQNNLVDNLWFGVDFVFNKETDKYWTSTTKPVKFSTAEGRTWQDYINDVRLEIACGEAPYLVSRYDTVSGDVIELSQRIGLLDRKLRVVSENTQTKEEWLKWTVKSIQNTYGYDWQGDNVLLARENLLFTFIDYYKAEFDDEPAVDILKKIANILSWNIWQMDGLKFVIPESCKEVKEKQACPGCAKNDPYAHTGTYCIIKDWKANKKVTFVSLLKKD